ncbi:MAG: hypothetical protein ACLFN5_07305 [bacterium]
MATTDVLEVIGSTPVVKLKRLTKDIDGEIYLKLESLNPGGSQLSRRTSGAAGFNAALRYWRTLSGLIFCLTKRLIV